MTRGARTPAANKLTGANLARARGGGSTRRAPAVGAVKALAKPVYRPFTRANFRHNLAQRTGGIPENAQAHHVLPVKFEVQCSKAGINIHDPKFGTWWPRRAHQKNARAYNDRWEEFLRTNKNPTGEHILRFGRTLAKEYGLAIGF